MSEQATQAPKTESREFQAEVSQLLKLMIHSVYSNGEIFLRELISNASDACDKLRFEALSNDALYESDGELKIRIDFDAEAKTLTIKDNGIGMARAEVVDNIGTIARSGTKRFLEAMTGDQKQDANMIGQFGVGFYSAFVVADKVTLRTRRAGEASDQATQWESDGTSGYELTPIDMAQRGTEIILHLRDDQTDFLDDWRLRSVIKKYSDHIVFPVEMLEQAMPQEDEEEAPKELGYEQVNSASALWTRNRKDIEDDEYKAFYRTVAHDYDDPVRWIHSRVEGNTEYTSLLYLPKNAPFDLYEREQSQGIKLYVRRVFIMDEKDKLMPRYLRFVRGLVDSNDLPLNVSRELLQSSKVIDNIRAGSVKKVLQMIEQMAKNAPEEYAEWWKKFGSVLKEGIGEDMPNKDRIAKLLRFASTTGGDDAQNVALDQYIERMAEGQDKIYFLTADSYKAAVNSPHLEVLKEKGIEVLLLSDRVDEWMMGFLTEYEGRSFVSAAKGDLQLDKEEDDEAKKARESAEKEAESILTRIKDALGDKVEKVELSKRLASSPACVVLGEHDMALHLQQLMRQAGHDVPGAKMTLEINASHPVIKRMDIEQDEDRFKEWSLLLLDQSVLAEGGQLEDGAAFVKRLNAMMLDLTS